MCKNMIKIEVVYFAYLKKEWDIFEEQLNNFIQESIYNEANKLNLCCTIDEERIPRLKKLINEKYPKWNISNISYTNTYE